MVDRDELARALTLEEKCSLTAGGTWWTVPAVERLGIGSLKVSDGPSGVRGESMIGRRSLSLPCGTAVGSTWDPGLVGELGAGKTEFARGVAEGGGVPEDEVASPTFALLHYYRGRIPLVHADFFRLQGEDDLYGTGYYELRDGGEAALVVEWADRIASAVPPDGLHLRLTRGAGPGDRRVAARATGPVSRRRLAAWAGVARPAATRPRGISSRRASAAPGGARRRRRN